MTDLFEPPRSAVTEAVRSALAEDLLPLGDITAALLDPGARARAAFVAREPGVLAGVACATEAFSQVDPSVTVSWRAVDGATLEAGQVIGEVDGRLASMLTAERTALNFLGHLSGVATLTARYVEAAAAGEAGSSTRVWDTRKTTPGLRSLEKAAVRAGGGANHRGNLSDAVLLKDNHLVGVGVSVGEGVRRARSLWPGRTVHVECDRVDQALEACAAGADAVLLDNMTPAQVAECVAELDAAVASGEGRRPLVEVSGGVDLESIASYAQRGVDCISVGKLTSSAACLDIGLDISPTA